MYYTQSHQIPSNGLWLFVWIILWYIKVNFKKSSRRLMILNFNIPYWLFLFSLIYKVCAIWSTLLRALSYASTTMVSLALFSSNSNVYSASGEGSWRSCPACKWFSHSQSFGMSCHNIIACTSNVDNVNVASLTGRNLKKKWSARWNWIEFLDLILIPRCTTLVLLFSSSVLHSICCFGFTW